MKIAVYAIALNEEQFVEKWYESAKDADYLLIADTGSTDGTFKKALSLGINVVPVSVKPWRFDVARNASLALIPSDIDYCIALDMDEVILPGWRQELEKALEDQVTRPRYKYTWSWNSDGTPGLEYGGDKIHARKGYRWKHPVHEVIVTDRNQEKQGWYNLEIHHYPDSSKSRGQYLPLLKLSTVEDPNDDRNAYYYARELFFNGLLKEASKEFQRHLALPTATWAPERAASYRYLAKCETQDKESHLLKAIEESPGRREAKVELALHLYEVSKWEECYSQATDALSIKEKPLDYLCEDFAWGELPHDLASISAWNLGKTKEAIEHIENAISIKPNARFLNNLKHYQEQFNNK
jgi:glycosyltransferase involved in cell wall biosynthesis